MLAFYRSDRAKTVITEGFHDKSLLQDDDSSPAGCLFSTDPFDESIRSKGCMILFLDIPRVIFSQYLQPQVGSSSRTALIPAEVANQYGPAKLLTYKSAVLLSRLIKAKRRLINYTEPVSNLSSLTSNLFLEDDISRADPMTTSYSPSAIGSAG